MITRTLGLVKILITPPAMNGVTQLDHEGAGKLRLVWIDPYRLVGTTPTF